MLSSTRSILLYLLARSSSSSKGSRSAYLIPTRLLNMLRASLLPLFASSHKDLISLCSMCVPSLDLVSRSTFKKRGDEEDHTLFQNHVGSSATFRNLQEDHDIAWARSKDLSRPLFLKFANRKMLLDQFLISKGYGKISETILVV
jgi:hypothetical protein